MRAYTDKHGRVQSVTVFLHSTAASNARYEHDTEAAETARDRLQRMTSVISNWGTW